jgi:hypothetical protein
MLMLRRIGLLGLLVLLLVNWAAPAQAGRLVERLATYPDWQHKPALQKAADDLFYPDWFLGDWQVTSTLVDAIAPLAPEIVTPGFEGNRQLLNQPVRFAIRFIHDSSGRKVISDRAFNGLSLARAYLGDKAVVAVKVDPQSVNRQITLLRSRCPEQEVCERQLVSVVSDRATESSQTHQFITSELFQQQFRGQPQLYFNQVENTTAYQFVETSQPTLTADQVTAIYLSPQDPDYLKAGDRPVVLYRYRLVFSPVLPSQTATH